MEQKAKLTVFAADHSHLSREAVINWAVEQFDLEGNPAPGLITSLRKEDTVEWANRYLELLRKRYFELLATDRHPTTCRC